MKKPQPDEAPPPLPSASIEVIAATEAVRRRPEMYIGPERRSTVLIAMAALEPFAATGARCSHVEVSWTSDGVVQVVDDDWSANTEPDPRGGTFIEKCLSRLYAPGSGRRGEGLHLVNLMSEWLIFEVHQPARLYRQRFELAEPHPPELGVASPPWRTITTFKPDARCVDPRRSITAEGLIQDLHRVMEGWTSRTRDTAAPVLSFTASSSQLVITHA